MIDVPSSGRAGSFPAPFVGREEETRRLLEALEPVLAGQAPAIVLILAPTGGGKTAFVKHLTPTLEARGAVVVAGKFDQVVRDTPHAALVEALRAWLRRAAVLGPREFEQVREHLSKHLGASAPILGALLPELGLFLGDLSAAPTRGIQEEDRNRFQFALLALLHAMIDGGRACLLFLDDLQWADAATLDLIVRIALDSSLRRVGFLLTHRSEDEDALARTSLAFLPLAGGPRLLTRLVLPPLSAGDIAAMLEFSRRAAPGPDAARALLARTGGNPLFVAEILQIEAASGPASPSGPSAVLPDEEVSGLLLRRLKELDPDQQALLGAAAMMSSHIESTTLAAVLDRDERSVCAQLEWAVRDAVLVRTEEPGSRATYRFRHDQLQHAALDLVQSSWSSLHGRLGQVLGERVVAGDASLAFDAAYHIHLARADPLRDEQRLLAARVDLVCARRARLAAAEHSAYKHAVRGCEILGEAGWSTAYALTLELNTEAACAAFAVGAAEEFRRIVRRVRERARSFIDELPMQEVLVVALTGSGEVPAAFDLVCEGARRFGLSLPSEPDAADIAAADRKIDLALATMTPEWLANADPVADPAIVAQLRLLGLGNAAAYTARPHLLRMLVALELDLSARHGFSEVTALALAYLSALDCGSSATVRRGIGIRESALAAARRVSNGAILARTLDIVHGMTAAWTGPLRDAVTSLLENARLALEHGAFDHAGYSALKGCFFALLSGTPLDEVVTLLDAWRRTLGGLGQRLASAYLARDRQVVELLRRRTARPTLVSGEFSDEASCWREYDAQDDHYGALYLAVGKLLLAAVFVDPAAASEASLRLMRHAKGGYGLPHVKFGRFYAALCDWDATYAGLMAPEDAVQRIGETLARLTGCAELVPPTFAHKCWLLRALLADLRGATSEALEAFDCALEGARESGYLHEAGLAADRASRVCARIGHWELAEAYRSRADDAWNVWGASARTGRRTCATPTPPTQREAEVLTLTTAEPQAIEHLMETVPRWFGARHAWLVRVGEDLEIVASAEGDRVHCHLASPHSLGSVPVLDPALVARVATAAVTHEVVPGPAPGGGVCLVSLVFQTRTHGVLALDLPSALPSAEALVAATFACAHVAAVIDAARLQESLSRQARERDRAEAALRKNASLLRNIIDATRAVIYVKGVDGRYLLVNRAYRELFGLNETCPNQTDFDIFPREVAQSMRDNDLEVLRSLQPNERLEDLPVHGEIRSYVSVKVPLLAEDGIPFAVCGVSADITEIRRTEEALRESQQRLMLATVSAKLGVWDWDIRSDMMTWNEQMFRLYGLPDEPPPAYGAKIWWDALHPDDAARAREISQAAVRGEIPYDTEFRVVHPDGTVRHIKADGVVLRDAEQQPIRVIGVNRDITAERELEERRNRIAAKMEEQQRWLEAVLDRTPVPLLLIEIESGRVTFANRAADTMAGGTFPRGIAREQYRDHYRLTDEHDRDLPLAQWPLIQVARGEKVEGQIVVWHTSAGRFPVLMSGGTLPAASDHPAIAVLAFQDVSELVRAIRARDEFLSIASHELKTPLTSLKMQVQLRERALGAGDLSAFAPEVLARTVSSDVRQIDRLTRLVDDILDVSRISSGRFPLTLDEPIDLVVSVRDVLDRSAAALAAAGCQVALDAPAAVLGRWDRGRIEQMVLNLLTNAWKYGRGRPIHLTVRSLADRAVLVIRDQGVGISPADQKRIFQPFERAISKDEVSGLGLGLHIVRRIVEAHGGSIRVESELGAGATFTVELPYAGGGITATGHGA